MLTLEQMNADKRNVFYGERAVCDPCQQKARVRLNSEGQLSLPEQRGIPSGRVTSYCMMAVHNPLHCPDIDGCTCHCHVQTGRMRVVTPTRVELVDGTHIDILPNESGTQLGAPNVPPFGQSTTCARNITSQIDQERRSKRFGDGSRSDHCWRDRHDPSGCTQVWCDCWCHKGESAIVRAARLVSNSPNPVVQEAVEDLRGRVKQAENNLTKRIGDKIGHFIWVELGDGRGPVKALMLPSVEVIYPEEHENL